MADDSKHGPLNRPHKRAAPRERPLDESEERFRQVAEHLDTVFWLYDLASSRTVYVSPQYEQLWGRSAAQLLDNVHAWVETLHPADRERVVAAMAERGDAHYQIEYRIVRPDGSVRWILERGFPVHDENGARR